MSIFSIIISSNRCNPCFFDLIFFTNLWFNDLRLQHQHHIFLQAYQLPSAFSLNHFFAILLSIISAKELPQFIFWTVLNYFQLFQAEELIPQSLFCRFYSFRFHKKALWLYPSLFKDQTSRFNFLCKPCPDYQLDL